MKRAAEEQAQAVRAAAAASFKSMLQEKGDITVNSRWSRVGAFYSRLWFVFYLKKIVFECF